MIIVGILLLAGAVVLAVLAWLARRRFAAMVRAETHSVGDLVAMRDAATQAAGPGSFRYKCEVVGATQPHPEGTLRAQITGTECVWHRHVVTHKYWVMERDSKGRRRRRNRTEKVAEHQSEMHFGVRDNTGVIAVNPDGSDPDAPEKVLERFEKGRNRQGTRLEIGGFKLDLGSGHGKTIGYKYEEWVLRPDRHLFVHGEVVDQGEALVMTKPDDGPFIVSTRNEQQLLASETKKQRWFGIGAAGAAVVGAIVVAVSFFV